jgi:two-component system response regulator YesN
MFDTGMDVTAVLVKANEDKIDARTQECVNTLNQICEPFAEKIQWITIIGTPVSQLSDVAECYPDGQEISLPP